MGAGAPAMNKPAVRLTEQPEGGFRDHSAARSANAADVAGWNRVETVDAEGPQRTRARSVANGTEGLDAGGDIVGNTGMAPALVCTFAVNQRD